MRKLAAALTAYLLMNVVLASVAGAVDFGDVPREHWAHEEIQYVTDRGLFLGKTVETFEPESGMTRGQMAAVLYRLAGLPETDAAMPYTDIPAGTYYYDAIRWAAKSGIFTEVKLTANTLTPDETITRGEFAVMLRNYDRVQDGVEPAGSVENPFVDMDDADEEVRDAILYWAYPQGILRGTTPSTMNPNGRLTRAHVAAMLCRYDRQKAGGTGLNSGAGTDPAAKTEPEPDTRTEPDARTEPEPDDSHDDYRVERLEIIRLANEVRVRSGAKECVVSEALMDAAQKFADTMPTDHNIPLEYQLRAESGCTHGVGCNLYRSTNAGSVAYLPPMAVKMWEQSRGHYVTLVNKGSDSMGVGLHYDEDTNTAYCVLFIGDCQAIGQLLGNAHR